LISHQSKDCPNRPVLCEFCGIGIDRTEYNSHRDFCGSRTEKCLKCNKFILLKDMPLHIESNCKKGLNNRRRRQLMSSSAAAQSLWICQFCQAPAPDLQLLVVHMTTDCPSVPRNENGEIDPSIRQGLDIPSLLNMFGGYSNTSLSSPSAPMEISAPIPSTVKKTSFLDFSATFGDEDDELIESLMSDVQSTSESEISSEEDDDEDQDEEHDPEADKSDSNQNQTPSGPQDPNLSTPSSNQSSVPTPSATQLFTPEIQNPTPIQPAAPAQQPLAASSPSDPSADTTPLFSPIATPPPRRLKETSALSSLLIKSPSPAESNALPKFPPAMDEDLELALAISASLEEFKQSSKESSPAESTE